MTVQQSLREGDLPQAIELATAAVRSAPASLSERILLAELLCASQDFERADSQLQAVLALEPSMLIPVGQWRQLIRAAVARQAVFSAGTVPTFTDAPTASQRQLLDLLIATREGRLAEAGALAATLEDARLPRPCLIDGMLFDDIRDLDDRFIGCFEVLAANGDYYWIDQQEISSLVFEKPRRPFDLLWRKAEIALVSGSTGAVFLPAIYPGETANSAELLGRRTDWDDRAGAAIGSGQRMWGAGEDAFAACDVTAIEFRPG